MEIIGYNGINYYQPWILSAGINWGGTNTYGGSVMLLEPIESGDAAFNFSALKNRVSSWTDTIDWSIYSGRPASLK
jgi:hypothetical protein